jgi:hypothetical protein
VFDGAPDAPPRWLPDWLRPDRDRTRVSDRPDERELVGSSRGGRDRPGD